MIENQTVLKFRHGLEGLLLWALLFTFSLLFCQGCVYLYAFLFMPTGQLDQLEALILLDSPPSLALQVLMAGLAFLFSAFFVVQHHHLSPVETLGLRPIRPLTLIWGICLILSAALLIDQVLWYFEMDLKPVPLAENTGHAFFNLNLADTVAQLDQVNIVSYGILVSVVILLNPLVEEFFFRGLLWNASRQNWSSWIATVLSSFAYAIAQFDLLKGVNALLLGLLYGLIISFTRSTWVTCSAHIVLSLTTFGLSYFGFSYGVGGDSYPVAWIVLAILLFLKSLIGLYLYRVRRPGGLQKETYSAHKSDFRP